MTSCTQPDCTGIIVDGYCDVCGSPAGAAPFVPAEAASSSELRTAADDGSLRAACAQPACTGMIVDGYCDVCGSPGGAAPFVPAETASLSGSAADDGSLRAACAQPGCIGMIVDCYCDVCGSPADAAPFVPVEAAASARSPALADEPALTAVQEPTCASSPLDEETPTRLIPRVKMPLRPLSPQEMVNPGAADTGAVDDDVPTQRIPKAKMPGQRVSRHEMADPGAADVQAVDARKVDGDRGLAEHQSDGVQDYRTRVEKAQLPDEVREAAMSEVGKLERISDQSPESGDIRTWLETILDLPWGTKAADWMDIQGSREVEATLRRLIEPAVAEGEEADSGEVVPAEVKFAEVESAEVESAVADGQETDSAEVESAVPDVEQVDTAEVESAEVESAEVESAGVGPAVAEVEQADAGEAESAVPDAEQADAGEAESAVPDVEQADAAEAESAVPDVEQGDIAEVESAEVESAVPDVEQGDIAEVESAEVESAVADVEQADAAEAESGVPDVEQGDIAEFESAVADLEQGEAAEVGPQDDDTVEMTGAAVLSGNRELRPHLPQPQVPGPKPVHVPKEKRHIRSLTLAATVLALLIGAFLFSASRDAGVRAQSVPSVTPTTAATVSNPSSQPSVKSTKTRWKGSTIQLEQLAYSAGPFETVRIRGRYRGGEDTFLQVQRREEGKWLAFPLPTKTDQSGEFTAHVELRPGRYRLRLLDPDSGVTSKTFVVVIKG